MKSEIFWLEIGNLIFRMYLTYLDQDGLVNLYMLSGDIKAFFILQENTRNSEIFLHKFDVCRSFFLGV